MSKTKVAIQGIEGCFHDAAARRFFKEDIEVVACASFPEMAGRLKADPDLFGIMAIENTIAGSLLQNHELIHKNSLNIIGECKMRISHSLAALPGQSLNEITEVLSHPMALMQCEDFLNARPGLKPVEKFDTAGSAREIAEAGLKGQAAICPELAAQIYKLEILASGIETNKHNFTRFLALSSSRSLKSENADKASVVFSLPHSKGALSKVLAILAFYDLNLTKIQSFPIVGREWEYKFYIDLAFDDYNRYFQALEAAKPLTSGFKVLGEYRSCQEIF